MDNTRADLFSRGSTPPPSSQPQPQQFGHTHESSNTQIDSLFQHLSPPDDSYQSGPTTPITSNDEQTPPAPNSNADRQTALLSLLSGPAPATARAPPANPQQVPTPPSASSRSGTSPTHNETQGKILLEQLMAGNPPMSSYSDSQRGGGSTTAVSNPSPPYPPAPQGGGGGYRAYDSPDFQQRSQPPEMPLPAPPQQQTQQQPPSPRKSMFDFVSPFDALNAAVKKKPVPAVAASASTSAEESSMASWTNVTVPDPKRQSVDNLLEHLTRGTASQMAGAPAYESYLGGGAGSDFGSTTSATESSRVPIPGVAPVNVKQQPQQVPQRTASPRASPPKTHAQRVPMGRMGDSPQGTTQQQAGSGAGNNRRDKESSPGPRGGYRKGAGQGKGNKNTNQSPSPQPQNIIFDVSQPLDEIQASRDFVKPTAIALVKQDPVFLSGTTIGATHWVAYAMTRGRVRVISRSSGDRTLLQLPPSAFPPTTMVSDMAVYGNRLAGVTSDGGFVVWELPELITDDVPGQILLCVPPSGPESPLDPLHSVKWHPKEPDTLAVASQSKLYIIDLGNVHSLRGQPIPQIDLPHIAQMLVIPSPLVAFDFDILHYALATISEDSSLIIWNIHDKLPYMTHRIRGEDIPSSITYVDGGIVVGRKNGTIFQLLSITSKNVLSTIKFVNGNAEDPDMFGHIAYDSRIQTLWVANSRRESMIAVKLHLEPTPGEEMVRGYIDQVVEFPGPKATIHFVILTADADPNGDEAHAACIAAKVNPGELALVAFSVHSSGVDQILVRREWYDTALASTVSKYPNAYPMPPIEQPQPPVQTQARSKQVQAQVVPVAPAPINPPTRIRTPSDDGEVDAPQERPEGKGRGGKGKNVNWKEKEENGGKGVKNANANASTNPETDAAVTQALNREIRKMEESLHSRIGRLIGKEMDKQNQRLEEARAHDQSEDFVRQEKILKLISTELTRNTTRVVEMAVKSEVQTSILPALETMTKNEVKTALNDRVSSGFVEIVNQNLPMEMEKLLLRPDISAHFAHMLSSNLTPLIDRHVKESVSKTLIPQTNAMHQELLREVRGEIHSIKAELVSWQSEAFRSQEASIRELEHTVRGLSEQVKFLTGAMHAPFPGPPQQQVHNSPGPNVQHAQPVQLRQNMPPQGPPQNYGPLPPPPQGNNFVPPPPQQQPVMHSGHAWYGPAIAAPQASHPAQPPPVTVPAPQQQQERTPPMKADQWDDIYLNILHTQDPAKLRDLLAHTNPELIMPLNGPTLVSQAVILTLVARLSSILSETPPNDEAFKNTLWWLQRTAALLRPEDKLITDFIPRVLPGVQTSLVATKQRLPLAVGGAPTLDIARSVTDVQDILRRKMPMQGN
ncbi:hypothetical protein MKEN_01059300 [Mycena kentingensis (nom. inval.)]|nr:hypothetical protein MKEN_01059300 [Mycena kentingensis (nom. inval.)]